MKWPLLYEKATGCFSKVDEAFISLLLIYSKQHEERLRSQLAVKLLYANGPLVRLSITFSRYSSAILFYKVR